MSIADDAAARENGRLVQGRQPSKFTHENVARIKDWLAQESAGKKSLVGSV